MKSGGGISLTEDGFEHQYNGEGVTEKWSSGHRRQIAEWRNLNTKRYGYRATYQEAVAQKDEVPPEYLRKLVKDNGDLSGKRFNAERKLCVALLRYMPLALYKLLENMPMPWEEARYVNVVYHMRGVLTLVEDTPTAPEPLYLAQWGSIWTKMRSHKVELQQECGTFRRVISKGNENEPPIDFSDYIMDREPPPALYDDLDEEDAAAVLDWFYDPFPRLVHPNQIRGSRRPNGYYFTIDVIETLFRNAIPILPNLDDRNYYYLWDLKSFYAAKAMHIAIPRAPKFEAPSTIQEEEGEWTEFNDLRRVIHRDDPRKPRFTMLTERQIAFPFLYSDVVDGVTVAPYRYPAQIRVENEDPAVPCFSWNPSLNPIKAIQKRHSDPVGSSSVALCSAALRKSQWLGDEEPEDGCQPMSLMENFSPFFQELPLENVDTKSAMLLAFAPGPFNEFEGGMKRRVDIPVAEHWCRDPPSLLTNDTRDKILRSYTQLLKHHVAKNLRRDRQKERPKEEGGNQDEGGQPVRRLDELANLDFFHKTKIDWLEAGLQVMRQGHNMLVQLINVKSLPYVHINYNFEAKPTRTLTTKEIKKSRLGPAFHLIRELLGFMKQLIDMHTMYRLGKNDSIQLADAIQYLFSHLGRLTGVYRYKLRAMRQIKRSRDLKHVLYSKFNVGEVLRGPGCGFWAPSWRVWVFFLRGMTPLLQRYLGNLTDRVLRGREAKGKHDGKRITRQRVETDKDVNIKEAFRRELREMLPPDVRTEVIRTMDQHMNEAFRHWRAGLRWSVPGLAKPLTDLVNKYVKLRAEEYVRVTQYQRKRINEGDTVDKQAFMKNLGRLTRLKLMDEQNRQRSYMEGTDTDIITPEQATEIYRMMANWLSDRGFKKISFPKASRPAELRLLELALNRLRDQHNIANRLTQAQREEQARIEEAFNSPHETLSKIVDYLARVRRFKNVEVEYMDTFSSLYPIYNVVPSEKLVDSFLDQYLWYEAMDQQRLFPNWVKPSDVEPVPILVYKWCQGINDSPGIWDFDRDESVVLLHAKLEDDFYGNIDWNLFRPLLELIMDKSLAEYIVSRHDVVVEFKDMGYHCRKGMLRGFMFSSFLAQYWGLVIDVLLLGTQRSQEIAGPARRPNPFMSWMRDPLLATSHPIRGYCRYKNEVYVLLKYTKVEADDVRHRYLEETKSDPQKRAANASVYGFKNFKQWPRDARMRLFLNDVNLARAVIWEFRGRLPPGIADINESNALASVYSKDNPNLLFDMGGFSVRILPVVRTEDEVLENESTWNLQNTTTRDVTARAFLQVSPDDVNNIRNKARRAIMMVGSSTFQSIAAKWNALVTEIVPYYREAILGTDSLQQVLARAEHRMQSRIMMALNSRAKARFPPVIFYAPTDLGGLGMLSVGHSLIPARDLVYSKSTSTGVQFFYSGLTNADNIPIPNILQYYTPWETEVRESVKAWTEFNMRDREAKAAGTRLSIDDIEHIINKGVPRIRVLFSRHAKLFQFDKGFRCRMEFQRYLAGKYLKNWWFHQEHDGNICGGVLERYRVDTNIALGGVEAILEHSLFRGTGFPSWEGIEFNRAGGFENSKKDSKLAKQQRAGLANVPNRRFALWWCPTINRSDVQAGFETKIDTTGVFMCGKLETIKKSLIKIFSGSLWEKCHGAVVNDIASKLKDMMVELDAASVTLQQQHPQKSYTYTSSAPDIVMASTSRWPVTSKPTVLSDETGDEYRAHTTSKYWIDVQLRWGNYDSHNIAEYTRSRFYEYSSAKMYPFPAGIVVAIDLAYNCHSAFGYWVPRLKPLMMKLMTAIIRHNIALNTLRERMKRDLQLFSSAPTEAGLSVTNIAELFSEGMRTWIVDDSATYVTSEQPTAEGGRKFRSENGAVLIFEPATGNLKLSIVHKSVFAGQKRRTKLAREKAAEEIASWLRSVPASQRPGKLIVTRSRFRQTLHNMLILDYPNIIIGQSDLNLAVPMVLRHSRLADLRISATESKGWEFCLYDDWLRQFQPATCFNLLNLILRGYHVNLSRTRQTLEPDLHVEVHHSHFWPTYTREEWEAVSVRLQEMIIADAARRMNVSPNQFTEMEKKDILLGKKMTTVEIQEEEMKELEEMKRTKLVQEHTIDVVTKSGETAKKRVKAAFDFGNSTSASNWRARSLANATVFGEGTTVEIDHSGVTGSSDQLIFPQELLKILFPCFDVQAQFCAYLFGQTLPDSPNVKEVLCIMVPPQKSSAVEYTTPSCIPHDHPTLTENHLSLLGVLRCSGGEPSIHSRDVAIHGRLLACNEGLQTEGLTTVVVGVSQDGIGIRCYTTTREGISWALEEYSHALQREPTEVPPLHVIPARVTLSTELQGFFLVPTDNGWNHTFRGAAWREDTTFDVRVDTPQFFFFATHRPDHFLNFARLTEEEATIDMADLENLMA
ncbi:PRP8 protein homologue [Trypanosoma brucei gambiense DAL972]|uniref:PRP8 protein homologue n=2 Tax=Trypanozoon TaxID=39700 RepID=C9ZYT5_TRYB9|nr:PRP8 protein homologue [Trypanosoma brucei gambiense DAL972]CBH14584.1 PRP8 protein homologue [Trypanosoma brucei gambiense DAL972]|eukprot:XP_011776850.1 PRP8 protein homologue [Trypanosoma brucei gambiense DAL972]